MTNITMMAILLYSKWWQIYHADYNVTQQKQNIATTYFINSTVLTDMIKSLMVLSKYVLTY